MSLIVKFERQAESPILPEDAVDVVTDAVWGMRETVNQSGPTAATVRLMPSTATDPLATI